MLYGILQPLAVVRTISCKDDMPLFRQLGTNQQLSYTRLRTPFRGRSCVLS
jgi:hypothetical protein